MFNIYTYDKKQGIPTDDICYIIAKGGVYLKKKMGLIDSLVPVKSLSFLDDINCFAKMNIPKIPGIIYAQIFDFFKKVYHDHRSEGLAIVYFNPKKKDFKVHIPEQAVTGSAVDVEEGYQIGIKNYQPVCSIHSHPGFSAFHSGIDTHDEEDFDGLHITVGEVDSSAHKIVASVVSNGYRVQVNPMDYIGGVFETEFSHYSANVFRPSFEMVGDEKVYKKDAKTKTGFMISQHLSTVECDPKWLVNVGKYNFKKVYGGGSYAGYGVGNSVYGVDDGYEGYSDLANGFDYAKYYQSMREGIPGVIYAPQVPGVSTFNPCHKCNLKFAKGPKQLADMAKLFSKQMEAKKIIETEEVSSELLWPRT
jgi:proteasome lid subunit RPN8/RPN11